MPAHQFIEGSYINVSLPVYREGAHEMPAHQLTKGSYTVEAALICPLLCLLLCFLLSTTLSFYYKVNDYGKKCILEMNQITPASDSIRMERILGDFWEELSNATG